MLKRAAIRAGLEVLALLGLGKVASAAGRGVILTLHHVRPSGPHERGPNAHLSVTPAFLQGTIATVLDAGLTPVRLADLPGHLAEREDSRRFVAFTLDDGYRNNRDLAAPLFRAAGIPFTIFVTPGFVERRRSAWWESAEALAARTGPDAFARCAAMVAALPEDEAVAAIDAEARAVGLDPLALIDDLVMDEAELRAFADAEPLLDYGAHTLTHVNLRRVDQRRLAQEVEGSIARVASYGRESPASFAFPYGFRAAVGPREADAVRAAGIDIAVTTQPAMLGTATGLGAGTYGRVSLNGLYQRQRFVRALLTGWPARLV